MLFNRDTRLAGHYGVCRVNTEFVLFAYIVCSGLVLNDFEGRKLYTYFLHFSEFVIVLNNVGHYQVTLLNRYASKDDH